MKIDIEVGDNMMVLGAWICGAIVVTLLIVGIWQYSIKAVELYTSNNYEEIAEPGSSIVYWRKARQE